MARIGGSILVPQLIIKQHIPTEPIENCFCTLCKLEDQEALSQLMTAKFYHLTAHLRTTKGWLQLSPLRNTLVITVGSRATLHPIEIY